MRVLGGLNKAGLGLIMSKSKALIRRQWVNGYRRKKMIVLAMDKVSSHGDEGFYNQVWNSVIRLVVWSNPWSQIKDFG